MAYTKKSKLLTPFPPLLNLADSPSPVIQWMSIIKLLRSTYSLIPLENGASKFSSKVQQRDQYTYTVAFFLPKAHNI